MLLVWYGAQGHATSLRVQAKLPAEVAIHVRLNIFGQIFANAVSVAIGDAEPLQLRSRLFNALTCRG